MPRLNSINFYQNRPETKLFSAEKIQNFRAWELRPRSPCVRHRLRSQAPAARGFPHTLLTAPPMQISGCAPTARGKINACSRKSEIASGKSAKVQRIKQHQTRLFRRRIIASVATK